MKELYQRHHVILHVFVIAGMAFAVYSNNYDHDYLLDSGHSLRANSYVRSLRHVPAYFRDPKTLTAYRANADYRPVLQITYALNYQWTGYRTWSWHLVQILLHLICALSLYLFCRRLLVQFEPEASELARSTIPFVVGLLFVVHPTASGVVNYLHARSSLLVAALLLPSFVLYLMRADDPRYGKTAWLSFALFGLALFAKVEAVAALAVYFSLDVLQSAYLRLAGEREAVSQEGWRRGYVGDLLHACNRTTLRRLWPFLALTAVYFIIRSQVMDDYVAAARHAEDVTGAVYFTTQLTAWWHYVLRWFAPVGLIADYQVYPVYRSLVAPPVLLALAGWILVAGLLRAGYRRHPHYLFLAVSGLALLSPTSSVLPLAEMVNEHRPYLPLALFSLIWLIPGLRWFFDRQHRSITTGIIGTGLVVLLVALFSLTFVRNRTFHTNEAYYTDLLKKAPSARAHVNYGLTQMEKGRVKKALHHYEKALALAPRWHIILTNLGVAHQRLGNSVKARFYFDQAVKNERYGGVAREYRGHFRLAYKDYQGARQDFEAILTLCRECYRTYRGLATAYAGLGDWRKSVYWTKRCLRMDRRRAEREIAPNSAPFWEKAARHEAGYRYYQAIDKELPGRWWVQQNLADLASKLGMQDAAARHRQRSNQLKGARR